MTASTPAAPVVVGVDGSRAAIEAALWAADEAIDRGALMRMIHVVDVEDEVDRDLDGDPSQVARDWPETKQGLVYLEEASTAVQSTGRPVTVETQMLWGGVAPTLIDESKAASIVCVGSVGIAPVCQQMLGSTAATVAEGAHSTVAVIRSADTASASEPEWIVAVIDGTPGNDAVVVSALAEASLRRAPVLALGVTRNDRCRVPYDQLEHRVAGWRRDHPYVHVYPVSVPTDAATFLAQHDELSVQLVVLSASSARQVPAIVGMHRPTRRAPNHCSVLVVR